MRIFDTITFDKLCSGFKLKIAKQNIVSYTFYRDFKSKWFAMAVVPIAHNFET